MPIDPKEVPRHDPRMKGSGWRDPKTGYAMKEGDAQAMLVQAAGNQLQGNPQIVQAYEAQVTAITETTRALNSKIGALGPAINDLQKALSDLTKPLKDMATKTTQAATRMAQVPVPTTEQTKSKLATGATTIPGALSFSASEAGSQRVISAIPDVQGQARPEDRPPKEGTDPSKSRSMLLAPLAKGMFGADSETYKRVKSGQSMGGSEGVLKSIPQDIATSATHAVGRGLEMYGPLAMIQRRQRAREMSGELIPNLGDASTLGYSSRGSYVGSGTGPGIQLPFTSAASQAAVSQQFEKLGYAMMPGVGMKATNAIFNNLYGLGWSGANDTAPRTNEMREGLARLTQQNTSLGTSPVTATMMDQATRFGSTSIQEFIKTMQQVPNIALNSALSMQQVIQSMQDYQTFATSMGAQPGAAQKAGLATTAQTGMPFSALQSTLLNPLGMATMMQQNPGMTPLNAGYFLQQQGVATKAATSLVSSTYNNLLKQYQQPGVSQAQAQGEAIASASQITGMPAQYINQMVSQKGTWGTAGVNAAGQRVQRGAALTGADAMNIQGRVATSINQAQQLIGQAEQHPTSQQGMSKAAFSAIQQIVGSMQEANKLDPGLYSKKQIDQVQQAYGSQIQPGDKNPVRVGRGGFFPPQTKSKFTPPELDKAIWNAQWQVNQEDDAYNSPKGKTGGAGSLKAGNATISLSPQAQQYFTLLAQGTPPDSATTAALGAAYGLNPTNAGHGADAVNSPWSYTQ